MKRPLTPEADEAQGRALRIIAQRGWSAQRLADTIGVSGDIMRGLTNGVTVPHRSNMARILHGLDAVEAGTTPEEMPRPEDQHNMRALARFMDARRHRRRTRTNQHSRAFRRTPA
ncbi:hypothetical protein [Nesterenkonia sp. HG001]|uniref:hypothetical protein n=1 Tax=Nesterenkonia sp. HG001 TaxID=2983207 RepID=UPI002AC4CD2C|nr:hypothetical protein [Nesterenkonia sp. HG001]MDZ5076776.1 helix-turn-helix domain-containing protein [Nesterenkonia sp. HG001]